MSYISDLATRTFSSPNCELRTTSVVKVTPHHAAGDLTPEQFDAVFSNPNSYASANYSITSDGTVSCHVPENYRAWTSSSFSNDNQAITIEVANDVVGEDWHVSDTAYETLIQLCVDICKRYNIPELVFDGTPNGTLTYHQMFAPTACPGDYLKSYFGDIAREVNRRLKEYIVGWIQDGNGWWYQFSDGSYINDGWHGIDGYWYYFEENGYAVHDRWLCDGEKWFYFDSNCRMMAGWIFESGFWYYLGTDGAMQTGLTRIDNQTYYLRETTEKRADGVTYPVGSMFVGWKNFDGKSYYFNHNLNCCPIGAMMRHHRVKSMQDSNIEYYLKDDSSMARNEYVMDGDVQIYADEYGVIQ